MPVDRSAEAEVKMVGKAVKTDQIIITSAFRYDTHLARLQTKDLNSLVAYSYTEDDP